MIRYREIRPSKPLQSSVATFWILEHDGNDSTPQRVVPDGRSELILNWGPPFEYLRDSRWIDQPSCFLAGQLDGPLHLRPTGASKILGIRFHPHGASRFLSHPMDELSGRFAPVSELSSDLFHRLETVDSANPIAAIEAALLASNGALDSLVAEAVRRIELANGRLDLAKLARVLGLSTRQFERRFQAVVGLAPKFYCRIHRFNRVFRALEEESANWADTAVSCGYYDQAHLIRDCNLLCGTTPARLLGNKTDLARHFYMSHSSNTVPSIRV